MIDAHTHLFLPEFADDINAVIERSQAKGIQKFLMPNVDEETIDAMHHLADTYPNRCIPMMGLHPCSVKENWEEVLTRMENWFSKRSYCAVGEIGLDLYWDKTTLEIQKRAFKHQVEWAKKFKLPVVIHVREAFNEIFEVMDEVNDAQLTGVFHCFTGSLEQANRILRYGGFKLGIGGVVTYKNGGLDKVLPSIGLEHLVLETDSPYLPPVPHRGKRNESSYLDIIAERIAELKSCSVDQVKEATTENALSLFATVK